MNRYVFALFTFVCMSLSPFAFGMSFKNRDIRLILKNTYKVEIVNALADGQLPATAFASLDPQSKFHFAINSHGIYLKELKSGRVYRMNASGTFVLVVPGSEGAGESIRFHTPAVCLLDGIMNRSRINLERVEFDLIPVVTMDFWLGFNDSDSESDSESETDSEELVIETSSASSPVVTNALLSDGSEDTVMSEEENEKTSPSHVDFVPDSWAYQEGDLITAYFELDLMPPSKKQKRIPTKTLPRLNSCNPDKPVHDPEEKDKDDDFFNLGNCKQLRDMLSSGSFYFSSASS